MYAVLGPLPCGGDGIIFIALLLYVILKSRLDYFGVVAHTILYSLLLTLIGEGVTQAKPQRLDSCSFCPLRCQLPWISHIGHCLCLMEVLNTQYDIIHLSLSLK